MTEYEKIIEILKKLKLCPASGHGKVILTINDFKIVHVEKKESFQVK